MSTPYLSIVIPVYNEERRVAKSIEALNAYLQNKQLDIEVLFVDDGSKDTTIQKIHETKANFPYHVLTYDMNHGKGYAVKYGMNAAKGAYRLFMDADMSTPIEELDKFLPLMEAKEHVIIGSRKTQGSHVLRQQPIWRKKLGEVFTLLSNVFIVWGVTDFTCGFKMFSQEAAEKIFTRQQLERWGFDAEILFIAAKHGYKVKEVPVNWTNDDETKVNLTKDVMRSLNDLYTIRKNDFQRRYE